jgi:hypothetical protein
MASLIFASGIRMMPLLEFHLSIDVLDEANSFELLAGFRHQKIHERLRIAQERIVAPRFAVVEKNEIASALDKILDNRVSKKPV